METLDFFTKVTLCFNSFPIPSSAVIDPPTGNGVVDLIGLLAVIKQDILLFSANYDAILLLVPCWRRF